MSVLQNHKLQFKLSKKIIGIADKLIPSVDTLTYEICQIISDIREPLVDKPTTQYEDKNRNFQVGNLFCNFLTKFKLHVLITFRWQN